MPPANDLPPADGWTTADLDALPDDNIRRELLDGVLLVSPTPTHLHQYLAMRLGNALDDTCPPDFEASQGVEIRLSSHQSFIPDVLVVAREAALRSPNAFQPHEVHLAIEIVSPTSRSMDRITKPALFAATGIPYYWRIETKGGVRVHTHKIDPEHQVYRPTEVFDTVIETDEPWPISIPIARIIPRDF